MTWNANTPRGDLLPVDERPRITGNWDYIEAELQDDHFFDEDSDHDGHHKRVALTDLNDTGITLDSSGAAGIDSVEPAALPTSTEGQIYVRPKTATEAPATAAQSNQPFYMQNVSGTTHFMQLGIRAMAHVTISGGAISNNGNGDPWDYEHNIDNITVSGVIYTFNFRRDLPSTDYIVLATATTTSGNINASVESKAVENFDIRVSSNTGLIGLNVIVLGG
jgi:hypothetical protein